MAERNKQGLVALYGALTSIVTAILVVILNQWTSTNLISFSILFIIPAGALFFGAAAASGYYFGSKRLHVMPSRPLYWQATLMAAISLFLIHFLTYHTMTIEGQPLRNFVTFGEFYRLSFSESTMAVGNSQTDVGRVGEFWPVLAVLEFIGFLLGGVWVVLSLSGENVCTECNRYLQTIFKKQDQFDDPEKFVAYYDFEFAHPVDSEEFAAHVGREFSDSNVTKGSVRLETKLLGCPKCQNQWVSETVKVFGDQAWNDAPDMERLVPMPEGLNVTRAYRQSAK
ncbi:MAG: hypothetical protein AAFW97_06350 [Pseudomonadota bacterium]